MRIWTGVAGLRASEEIIGNTPLLVARRKGAVCADGSRRPPRGERGPLRTPARQEAGTRRSPLTVSPRRRPSQRPRTAG